MPTTGVASSTFNDAYDILMRAVGSFEKKTGDKLFLCGRFTDAITSDPRLHFTGPLSVAEEVVKLNKKSIQSAYLGVFVYNLPDLRKDKWWTAKKLRKLIARITKCQSFKDNRSRQHWGKQEYRPSWWPVDVPYMNPRHGLTVDQMKHVVVSVYARNNLLHLLGQAGKDLALHYACNYRDASTQCM